MAKDFAKPFYNSKAWQDCRAAYIAGRVVTDGGMCEHCKQVPGLIVDHVEEISSETITDAWLTLSHDNLQYLCLACHNRKTFGTSSVVRPGLSFDADGNLVEEPTTDRPHA